MREISVSEIKNIELNILRKVADFCERNNIRYFLAYGTLLGAIRHKGFIPWDDDIDIVMPRPDYNRFIRTFHDDFISITSPVNDESCIFTFAKVYDNRTVKIEGGIRYEKDNVYGVDIDIFPLDGCPESKYQIIKLRIIQKLLFYLHYFSKAKPIKNRGGIKYIVKIAIYTIARLFAALYGHNRLIKKINANVMKYDFDKSNLVCMGIAPFSSGIDIFDRSIFTNSVKVLFEGEKFNAPIGYDEFLKVAYGDYMKLPPEEKRVSHHSYIAYWKVKEGEYGGKN